jgi:cell division protein FtsQ
MNWLTRGNRRRRERPRAPSPRVPWLAIGSVVATLALIAGVGATGRWLLNRPVTRVVINGQFERVSADQLEAVLRPLVGKGFLAADLREVQARVAGVPWVATARVARRWPNTLTVTITEEEPAARWGAAGLLNREGRLFVRAATHIPAELPRLAGPAGSEAEVAARYVAIREELLPLGLGLSALSLDRRGAWSLMLSNGVAVRLGSVDLDTRLARLYEALDTVLGAQAADVQFVDLRYTNGFSVGWKQARPNRASEDEPLPFAEELPRA